MVKAGALVVVNPHQFSYRDHTGKQQHIDTDLKTCTCSRFFDRQICKHLAAACIINNVLFNGLQVFPKRLKTVRVRARKLNDTANENAPQTERPLSPIQVEVEERRRGRKEKKREPVQQRASSPAQVEPEQTQRRGRGRPPKVKKALEID